MRGQGAFTLCQLSQEAAHVRVPLSRLLSQKLRHSLRQQLVHCVILDGLEASRPDKPQRQVQMCRACYSLMPHT